MSAENIRKRLRLAWVAQRGKCRVCRGDMLSPEEGRGLGLKEAPVVVVVDDVRWTSSHPRMAAVHRFCADEQNLKRARPGRGGKVGTVANG